MITLFEKRELVALLCTVAFAVICMTVNFIMVDNFVFRLHDARSVL